MAEPTDHFSHGPERSHWVCNAFAHDIKCTPVNWLKHTWILPCRVQVASRRNPYTPRQARRQITEDIRVQVRSDDRIQGLRVQNHPRSHRVDQHLVALDILEILLHNLSHLVPEYQTVALRVGFRDHSDLPSLSLPRCLESEPQQALHAVPRKDRDLSCDLPGLTDVRAPALTCVFTLTILAYDNPV